MEEIKQLTLNKCLGDIKKRCLEILPKTKQPITTNLDYSHNIKPRRVTTTLNYVPTPLWIFDPAAPKLISFLNEKKFAEIIKSVEHLKFEGTYPKKLEGLWQRFDELIWDCAQNRPYPEFYQAWHFQRTEENRYN